ncbi:uncharacterized protein PGTG_12931 [Puccinia graminis f. sp. tritici CRL 75-36-700-3]|uniref:Uncharacterized protein n=1 Tax=Puccinia graminis f. sp. tritici (strain CRL 75-36-700-3 / race SCCL) TaxID=418459 RepID=E3KQH4_PUCGT|nr:uncharacterized protein PGTG_12931 [Puccinia graminis f. sp. tritici CRL 75-36-700-3]EFP86549.2 hypothetical protein PGTG_12931 [Puccinia graminis f. sp. tritici CRL 75-36-700-3]
MRLYSQNIQEMKLTSAILFQIQAMIPATKGLGNEAIPDKSPRAPGIKQHMEGTTRRNSHRISNPPGTQLLARIESDRNKTQSEPGDHIWHQ